MGGGPLPYCVARLYCTSMTIPVLRVLIVADDPLARAGVAALLAAEPQVTVSGSTGSDEEPAVAQAAFAPDIVIWDLGWDAAARIDALSRFCDECDLPVLALVADGRLAADVRAAGGRGLLNRSASGAQLAAAAVALAHDLLVFADELLPVGAIAVQPGGESLMFEALSARELDVLHDLAEGLSNKQIARSLSISEHTVKFHINAILGKLGAQSRTEAVVRATRAGIILL